MINNISLEFYKLAGVNMALASELEQPLKNFFNARSSFKKVLNPETIHYAGRAGESYEREKKAAFALIPKK